MIKQAIEKPVRIEFIEWTGDNTREVFDFTGVAESLFDIDVDGDLVFVTSAGVTVMEAGDLIIKYEDDLIGHLCPEEFHKTYTVEGLGKELNTDWEMVVYPTLKSIGEDIVRMKEKDGEYIDYKFVEEKWVEIARGNEDDS